MGLTPIAVSGQSTTSDSLLFSLIHQSIDVVVIDTLNIFQDVMISKPLLHNRGKLARGLGYFTQEDLNGIANQIKSPRITSWNYERFNQEWNVKITGDKRAGQCLFLSLPLISQDQDVIVIYYENRLKIIKKRSTSGTVTVWRKNVSDQWILEKQQVIWMSR